MTQQKLNYIHYYLLAIVSSILIWCGFEYISICNGQACKFDLRRLWCGVLTICVLFIPITLCIWSEFVNGQMKNLGRFLKRTYEEQILIFGICILTLLFFVSYKAFNIYWGEFVGTRASKEYVAALVNVAIFVATIFAPIAALLLYKNWKVQHNLQLFSEDAKKIWNLLNEERTYWKELCSILDDIPENSMPLRDISKYKEKLNESNEKARSANREILKFINLTKDVHLNELLNSEIHALLKFKSKYEEQCNLGYGCTNTKFNSIHGIYIHEIASSIINIENYIRDKYILMT